MDSLGISEVAKVNSIFVKPSLQRDSIIQEGKNVLSNVTDAKLGLDSIQRSFWQESASLKQSFQTYFFSLDSSKNSLKNKVDSLNGMNLPTEKYTHKIDSIAGRQHEVAAELNDKLEELKAKNLGKIDRLELSPELQAQIGKLTKDIDGFKLPVKDFNIPALNGPNNNSFAGLDGLNSSIQSSIGQVGNIEALPEIPTEFGKISDISQQAGKYGGDLKNISTGNLKDVQQLPKGLEDKAGQMAGIGDMKKQTDGLLGQAMPTRDPAAMKKQVIQEAQKQAVNHFAGKEDVLKEAMDKMTKLKTKYESLSSLSEVTKERPNAMRGKSFRERLLPGIALQIQKKGDNVFVDFNPYAGYKFTRRITMGIGWNQRLGYTTKYDKMTSASTIFGPRAFGEFNLGNGFVPRAEFEYMNTLIPPSLHAKATDIQKREWVPGVFIGLKKEYKLLKNVKGNAMIMARVFNYKHKSPYNDILNMRIGFEFQTKTKK